MDTYRVRTKVSKDGYLSITGLPFRPGAEVEVIVRAEPQNRQALVNELKALFEEIQSLPLAQTITEEEIAAEIAAYRASRKK
ncbi:MAG: hypothetical protein DCC59_10950 [Chloroflexi bacterium]|nr:hypothetical protein [Anaerolineales bacterium]NUQ60743.1 hypothetical protein [Anaerolineales bacterium]RIK52022.1 MAG: hypothetical protein DCC59_10950 [Chloroflexota bacterium]